MHSSHRLRGVNGMTAAGPAVVTGTPVHVFITEESLDSWPPYDLGSHSDGAILVFQGRVREMNEGRAVSHLEYDCYKEMAEKVLRDISKAALARFDIGAVWAAHRTGTLRLGEVSVAIGVASGHRADCYEASRWIIEAIKERLPVWKHEHYADGTTHWVGSPELDNK